MGTLLCCMPMIGGEFSAWTETCTMRFGVCELGGSQVRLFSAKRPLRIQLAPFQNDGLSHPYPYPSLFSAVLDYPMFSKSVNTTCRLCAVLCASARPRTRVTLFFRILFRIDPSQFGGISGRSLPCFGPKRQLS